MSESFRRHLEDKARERQDETGAVYAYMARQAGRIERDVREVFEVGEDPTGGAPEVENPWTEEYIKQTEVDVTTRRLPRQGWMDK